MSDTLERQANFGLYKKIVKDVKYAARARNGSFIPAVSYLNFGVIHGDLPKKLWDAQEFRACDLDSHFDGGAWRYSHQNDAGDLPEWEIESERGTLKFAQESTRDLTTEQHRFQQFQEIDVRKLLGQTKDKGSKEAEDVGAMRLVVDECFGHVYVTVNHYRDIAVGKHMDTVNPWILVLFDGYSLALTEWTTDRTFYATNITEAPQGSSKATVTFGDAKYAVTLIRPKQVKRSRRNSYTFSTFNKELNKSEVHGYTPPGA